MTTITYPDGSIFTSSALTQNQLQTTLQLITAQILGLTTSPLTVGFSFISGSNIATVTSSSLLYSGQLVVASALPDGTQITGVNGASVVLSNKATQSIQQNATVTDPLVWNKCRISWQEEGQPGPDINSDTVTIRATTIDTDYSRLRDGVLLPSENNTSTQQDIFTRTWSVFFSLYGPNSLLNAKIIQSAFIKIPYVDYQLAASNLYVNPSIAETGRNPELFQGEWWERADLTVEFNEEITETLTVGTVGSVEVKIYDKTGEIEDFTVSV